MKRAAAIDLCLLFVAFRNTHPNSNPNPSREAGLSDWDIMMQRRKEAMARKRRRRKGADVTLYDDSIMAMIRQMKHAAEVSNDYKWYIASLVLCVYSTSDRLKYM